ncbi:hypothetical protein BH11ARM1_BH11ARM1_02520 [soil metagenome]
MGGAGDTGAIFSLNGNAKPEQFTAVHNWFGHAYKTKIEDKANDYGALNGRPPIIRLTSTYQDGNGKSHSYKVENIVDIN